MAAERKAVIKNADMSEDMQQDAVDCASQALEKFNLEKDIAAFVKKEFDKLRRKNMVDKLYIIKQILETDEDTDIKILSILELAKENPDKENIHRIEERVAKRKKIMIEVSLNMEKEKVLAETEDISSTGAFIRTNKKVGKGEHISIKLTDPKGEEFTFVAKVMRVNPDGIGVMVKTISLNDRDNLTNFLDRL
jgi:hypothetical protein